MENVKSSATRGRWSKADIIAALAALTALVVTYLNYRLWQEARDAVVVANAQVELSRKAFESEERARIVPTGARFLTPLRIGQPLKIQITYKNVGREPAVISSENQQYAIPGFVKAVTGMARDIPVFENTTCPTPNVGREGLIVYPHTSGDYSSVLTLPAEAWRQDVLNGTSILYIAGCFIYQTMGAVHRSAYCFYLKPDADRRQRAWQFFYCSTGNFAD